MRRRITEVTTSTMHPVLFCWCVAAIFSVALAAWQENVRPKMYVQLGYYRRTANRRRVYKVCPTFEALDLNDTTTTTTTTTTMTTTTMTMTTMLRRLRRLG
ncbi:semaphorin-1A [Vespula maculifrons]|uniref:Semaphorin-1A n=1 Tax=Vespula maculifrons TaxID=7453 RepID=A0ABD2BHT9_VESMC